MENEGGRKCQREEKFMGLPGKSSGRSHLITDQKKREEAMAIWGNSKYKGPEVGRGLPR